ncbi:magnesium and cobalt transport protein CorA [Kitasatospora sp. MBT63]|uniref:magnesium and cobalt transport protein CorA n=1 Tax=Kitasatospora sp. MBT63 TaxID=1444768 RepID=UPI0009E94EE3|nr:magnesium and cobalt transport protein CorA [Kitasatospora sp. MBT63]
MIVDCAHYLDGRRQHEGPIPLEQAAARCAQGGFVWLGLFEPGPEELAEVRASFGLHELAVEDAQAFHLRPKAEQYEDGTELIILRTARYDDGSEEVDTGEISIFLAEHFVIAVRQGIASELAGARSRLEQRPELLRTGSASTLWAILDQVVDSYAPVVAELERDIEQIEATVFSGTVAPTERIYFLRREATDFYRAVHPLLAVLTRRLQPGKSPPALLPYFRDVHDHLLLVNEEVAAQRDLLATVLEANIAVISVEQNRINLRQTATMERLTILASVFLPLSFVVGFFGQNFAWLVRNINSFTAFLTLGIGGLLLPCLLLFLWLRRRRGHTAPPAPEVTAVPTGPPPASARGGRAERHTG